MKKILTLLAVAVALLTTVPAQAQVKFGLKGGVNVTNMSFSSDVLDATNRAGFFIGPTVKFTLPIVGLGVDASALYDQREGKAKISSDKAEVESDNTIKQQQVVIPINLRYGVGLGVNVGAGLMLLNHLQLSANYNIACGHTGDVELKSTAVDAISQIAGFKKGSRANAWQIGLAYYF